MDAGFQERGLFLQRILGMHLRNIVGKQRNILLDPVVVNFQEIKTALKTKLDFDWFVPGIPFQGKKERSGLVYTVRIGLQSPFTPTFSAKDL